MADDGLWATNAQMIARAGLNANATATAVGWTDLRALEAESMINTESEYIWTAAIFAALDSGVKSLLTTAEACLVALAIIDYDPNSWNLETANFKRNSLWTLYDRCIKLLREVDQSQIWMREA